MSLLDQTLSSLLPASFCSDTICESECCYQLASTRWLLMSLRHVSQLRLRSSSYLLLSFSDTNGWMSLCESVEERSFSHASLYPSKWSHSQPLHFVKQTDATTETTIIHVLGRRRSVHPSLYSKQGACIASVACITPIMGIDRFALHIHFHHKAAVTAWRSSLVHTLFLPATSAFVE